MEKKYAYKTKYQKDNLKRIYVDVKKEIGEEFDKTLKENGLKRADVLTPAIENFLKKYEKIEKKSWHIPYGMV